MRGDASLNVRAEAARGLGQLRQARWAPELARLLRERSYWDILKSGAIQGLASLKDRRFLGVLKRACLPAGGYPGRAWALRSLPPFGAVDPGLVAFIAGFLGERDDRVSLAAALALGRMEDERAIPHLERCRDATASCRLKTYAEESIARIRNGSEASSKKKAARR